jgi:adenylyl cyclase-associated protein
MTHKNPALRQSVLMKTKATGDGPASTYMPIVPQSYPSKLALEGNKWIVENFVGNRNIVIDRVELRHSMYIFNCTDCVIHVKGKLNQISLGKLFDHQRLGFPRVFLTVSCPNLP